MQRIIPVLVMAVAAVLEVGGDAIIRVGLRGRGVFFVVLGALVLAAYGIVVNLLKIDFSKLLAAYVAFFAVASVAFGHFAFDEAVPTSTWIGLGLMIAGSAVVLAGVSS
jgi:small multidrug resistance family-3 protein